MKVKENKKSSRFLYFCRVILWNERFILQTININLTKLVNFVKIEDLPPPSLKRWDDVERVKTTLCAHWDWDYSCR